MCIVDINRVENFSDHLLIEHLERKGRKLMLDLGSILPNRLSQGDDFTVKTIVAEDVQSVPELDNNIVAIHKKNTNDEKNREKIHICVCIYTHK